MVRVKNYIKIITIIAFIVAIGYTFARFVNIAEPTGAMGIYIALYFTVIVLSIILRLLPDRVINFNKIKERVEYNDFEGIYQELLTNHKQELDKYRIRIMIKRIIQAIFVITFILIYLAIQFGWIVYLNRDFALLTPYIAVGAVVMFFLSFFVCNESEKMYKKLYKEKVIGTLIKKTEKALTYSTDILRKPVVLNAYAKAEFDVTEFNSSYADDYIFGYLEENVAISMADLDLKRIIRSSKSSRTIKIFTGIFVDITCNKNIGATIKILMNRNRKHSKWDALSNKSEKLKMESQAFEKYFNVYSDNKIVAMQVLTSEILEILTDLRETFGIDLEIAIDNNHIYLRLHTGSMFEARVFGASIRRADVLTYYGVLKMIDIISKKLNEIIINSNI